MAAYCRVAADMVFSMWQPGQAAPSASMWESGVRRSILGLVMAAPAPRSR